MTSYYICAWILGSDIVLVGSRSAPFTHNEQPLIEADYRIVAEMSGEMKDAGELFSLLSLEGQTLVGLDFISQSVEPV